VYCTSTVRNFQLAIFWFGSGSALLTSLSLSLPRSTRQQDAQIEWILSRQPVRTPSPAPLPPSLSYLYASCDPSSTSLHRKVDLETRWSSSLTTSTRCNRFNLGADSTPKRARPNGSSASSNRPSHLSSSPLHAQHTPNGRPTAGPSRLNGASPTR